VKDVLSGQKSLQVETVRYLCDHRRDPHRVWLLEKNEVIVDVDDEESENETDRPFLVSFSQEES